MGLKTVEPKIFNLPGKRVKLDRLSMDMTDPSSRIGICLPYKEERLNSNSGEIFTE